MDGCRLALALALAVAGCAAPTDDDAATGIEGMVLLGPTCPVESDPPDPACADRPYSTELDVRTLDDRFVKAFRSGEDGRFQVALAPGQYRVASPEASASPPHCGSEAFTVRLGETTHVDVACDSGIR